MSRVLSQKPAITILGAKSALSCQSPKIMKIFFDKSFEDNSKKDLLFNLVPNQFVYCVFNTFFAYSF